MIPGIVASRLKRAAGPVQGLKFLSTGRPPSSTISPDGRTWTSGPDAAQLWNKSRGVARSATAVGLYFEVLVQTVNVGRTAIGLATSGVGTNSGQGGTENAGDGGRYQYFDNGQKRSWGTYTPYASGYTTGDRVGVSMQMVSGYVKIHFYKNGVNLGEAFSTNAASTWDPHFCSYADAPASVCQLVFPGSLIYLPPGFEPWA